METPKSIKRGSVEVVVRKFSDGRYGYDSYDNGRRKQHRWIDFKDAVAEARKRVRALADSQVDLLSVSKDEWAIFSAWKKEGFTIEDLADFRAWRDARTKSRLVSEVEAELIEIKEADSGLDKVWTTNIKGSLKPFLEAFGERSIVDIDAGEIEAWLRGLGKKPRTRNNMLAIIVMLFRHARDREYLPWGEKTAAERVPRLKIRATANDIEIYSPKELISLSEALPEQFLPWLALGAFAGIRTEEVCPHNTSKKDPLRWSDFLWAEKQIFVRAETAKTGRQRYVPMPDNLIQWLEGHKKQDGRVLSCPVNTLYTNIARLPKEIAYRKNALRHSYGSYRNAIIRNINQLAEEMGNSPGIARRNYEKPQPRSVAEKWFSIFPEKTSDARA